MPIYEYICRDCNRKFEKLIRLMNASESPACPECGSNETSRMLSLFAVGAEQQPKSQSASPGMCGRCGGPGPCAME